MEYFGTSQKRNLHSDFYNDQPLLSICVATYNREHLLERLLSSGRSGREVPEWNDAVEWIIVDDG